MIFNQPITKMDEGSRPNVFVIDDGHDQVTLLTGLSYSQQISNVENDIYVTDATMKILDNRPDILSNIKAGDIVQLSKDPYRNDGKLIWDGEKIMCLDCDIDEYGGLPSKFTFPTFPLRYWNVTINHNFIRWPDDNIKKQIKSNLVLHIKTCDEIYDETHETCDEEKNNYYYNHNYNYNYNHNYNHNYNRCRKNNNKDSNKDGRIRLYKWHSKFVIGNMVYYVLPQSDDNKNDITKVLETGNYWIDSVNWEYYGEYENTVLLNYI